jgi:hypothetical protein
VQLAGRVRPEEAPVDHDHLAVELLHGAEAEVAVRSELGKGQVALVGAVEERVDRRRLEDDVSRSRVVAGVQPLEPLEVDGSDEHRVEGQATIVARDPLGSQVSGHTRSRDRIG